MVVHMCQLVMANSVLWPPSAVIRDAFYNCCFSCWTWRFLCRLVGSLAAAIQVVVAAARQSKQP